MLVADHIREHCYGPFFIGVVVRPWAWMPSYPPETRNDVFESLLLDDGKALRTYWDLDELLRDYRWRYGVR